MPKWRIPTTTLFALLFTSALLGVCHADGLKTVDASDLPKISISVGNVEFGIRYKLESETSLRETYTKTLDYRNTTTSTFDVDQTSTITKTRNVSTSLNANFKIGFGTDSFLEIGGGNKIDNTTTVENKHIDHSRYESVQTGIAQSLNVVQSDSFKKASFDGDSGYIKVDISVVNSGTKNVTLRSLDIAVLTSSPFGDTEEVFLSGVVGVSSSTVPGGSPAGVPTELKIQPTAYIGAPYRFVVYFEKQPAAKIVELMKRNAIFRLQINGVEYAIDGVEYKVGERLAEITSTSASVRVIGPNEDETIFVGIYDDKQTLENLIKFIDSGSVIGSSGNKSRSIEKFKGVETKFSVWGRTEHDDADLTRFIASKESDGSWTVTLRRNAEISAPLSFDTIVKAGDKIDLIYLKKSDIIRSSVDRESRLGYRTSACATNLTPKQSFQPVCFKSVRQGDLLRVEGKAWRTGFETVDASYDKIRSYYIAAYPEIDPTQVDESLKRSGAKLRQVSDSVEVVAPSSIFAETTLQVGGLDPVPLQKWIDDGIATFESSVDGWFAISVFMPSTYSKSGAWVCLRHEHSPHKLEIGRFIDMTPPAFNSSCPPGSCTSWHLSALKWQSLFPRTEREVLESRAYKFFTHHVRRIRNEKEYLKVSRSISDRALEEFAAATPLEGDWSGQVSEALCPAMRWVAPAVVPLPK